MKNSEAKLLVATLAAAFPRQEIPQESIEVYAADLADLDADLARRAIENARRGSRWFPTIAEIREAAAELLLGAPASMAAWEQAVSLRADRHPLVSRARKMCGDSWYWSHLDTATSFARRDFLTAYSEVKAKAVAEIVQAPERRELTEGRRELDAGAQ